MNSDREVIGFVTYLFNFLTILPSIVLAHNIHPAFLLLTALLVLNLFSIIYLTFSE